MSSSDSDIGRTILLGVVGAMGLWLVSTALHENIEFYNSQERERQLRPLTEDQILAQDLIKMREERALANQNKH